MKIAFVGKGGSGKTTITSLFARLLAGSHLPVLVIDADINQHLAAALGMAEKEAALLPPMGTEIDRIKKYVRGSNPRIQSIETMVKTTPPGSGSQLLTLTEKNPIYDYFQRMINGVRIMATGPFDEEDLGVKCYHSKTGAVELFLNHLIDKPKEYIIVDMTAGADSFASGMFTRFDITFIVVEPTLKSLGVYKQYKEYAKEYGVNIKVIGNKIENDEDLQFLKENVGDDLLVSINRSSYVRSMEKGEYSSLSNLESENIKALKEILVLVDACQKDWKKFYKQAIDFHIKNALSWANASAGIDLTQQVDPNFSLESVLKE